MHIQLDPLGGTAGDMFIAAVIDACPELADDTMACIRSVGIAPEWQLTVIGHNDLTFKGSRYVVHDPGNDEVAHHHHYTDIAERVGPAPIDERARGRALAILEIIAEAEAEIHGVPVIDVSFHDVRAWDSIADIIGAAFLIEKLVPRSWALGPVPARRLLPRIWPLACPGT